MPKLARSPPPFTAHLEAPHQENTEIQRLPRKHPLFCLDLHRLLQSNHAPLNMDPAGRR